MYPTSRHSAFTVALLLALAFELSAQQPDDPQRNTLLGLRHIAVHARVQITERATLHKLDERVLHAKLEQALRQAGIVVQQAGDLRDGSAARISLVYLVIPTGAEAGMKAGFAASSCLHASQYVRIPRLEAGGRIAYTVAPTWSSCGFIVGHAASYQATILQNADEQIARFLDAWRSVNRSRPAPQALSPPELGLVKGQAERLSASSSPPADRDLSL